MKEEEVKVIILEMLMGIYRDLNISKVSLNTFINNPNVELAIKKLRD